MIDHLPTSLLQQEKFHRSPAAMIPFPHKQEKIPQSSASFLSPRLLPLPERTSRAFPRRELLTFHARLLLYRRCNFTTGTNFWHTSTWPRRTDLEEHTSACVSSNFDAARAISCLETFPRGTQSVFRVDETQSAWFRTRQLESRLFASWRNYSSRLLLWSLSLSVSMGASLHDRVQSGSRLAQSRFDRSNDSAKRSFFRFLGLYRRVAPSGCRIISQLPFKYFRVSNFHWFLTGVPRAFCKCSAKLWKPIFFFFHHYHDSGGIL